MPIYRLYLYCGCGLMVDYANLEIMKDGQPYNKYLTDGVLEVKIICRSSIIEELLINVMKEAVTLKQ